MDNNNTMEYRIGLEKQNKRNDQVTELILDNCRASQISGLTDEFVNLETLSLINVGLVTLKGFPKLPKLKKLELSDNRLTGGLNLLTGSTKLQHLNLSGNRIKDLEALEPLKEFHDLVNLDLYNCEVTKSDNYRQKVFDLVPNLNSLDGYDRNEREVADDDESDDEGSEADNRIARDDNEADDDDDEDLDGEESSYDEEEYFNGHSGNFNEVDVDDEEDDDEDIDDEDDDDVDDDLDEEGSEAEEFASSDPVASSTGASRAAKQGDTSVVENGDDVDDDEDDDEDDYDEAEEDGSDLKQLEKDIGDDEDSDDDDFEPTHEPDERDYEIDAEDDADEDVTLSTSALNSSAAAEGLNDTRQKGQKRKHEDEGGDEIVSIGFLPQPPLSCRESCKSIRRL